MNRHRACRPAVSRAWRCALRRAMPNAECPQRVATWYLPGVSPIKVSKLHQRLLIDKRTGEAVCEENAHTQWQTVEAWPTDMQRLFERPACRGAQRRQRRTAMATNATASATHAKPQMRLAADATGAPQIVSPCVP